MAFARLDLVEQWARLNDSVIALVDYVPDDKLEWSPREDLYTCRKILAHISTGRHTWLDRVGADGETPPGVESASTKDELKQQLRLSWERLASWLGDQGNVDRDYESVRKGEPISFSGNWAAFHLLEHDVHHRADIFHYLALLGIEHPDVGTP